MIQRRINQTTSECSNEASWCADRRRRGGGQSMVLWFITSITDGASAKNCKTSQIANISFGTLSPIWTERWKGPYSWHTPQTLPGSRPNYLIDLYTILLVKSRQMHNQMKIKTHVNCKPHCMNGTANQTPIFLWLCDSLLLNKSQFCGLCANKRFYYSLWSFNSIASEASKETVYVGTVLCRPTIHCIKWVQIQLHWQVPSQKDRKVSG